jgi:hypothetical protein
MELNLQLSNSIIFIMLVTIMIPSIICSLFIFYHFIRNEALRKRLNNHIILILLSLNFLQVSYQSLIVKKNYLITFFLKVITDMQFTLITLHTGFVPIQTYSFCIWWSVYNYALSVIDLMLMAYGCIERFFLVFHLPFFKRHLILLHYGPLIFFTIYPTILYIGLVVVYPCQNYFDYTLFTCGGPCYQFGVCLMLYPKSSE